MKDKLTVLLVGDGIDIDDVNPETEADYCTGSSPLNRLRKGKYDARFLVVRSDGICRKVGESETPMNPEGIGLVAGVLKSEGYSTDGIRIYAKLIEKESFFRGLKRRRVAI